MKVTSRDIARILGVSQSTVSRALQGKLVSRDMIDQVHRVARELGYQPNLGARMIATGKSGNIGLLVPTTTNPFFGQVIDAFQSTAYAHGYHLLLGVYQNDPAEAEEYFELLIGEGRVDGLVVYPCDDPAVLSSLNRLSQMNTPIVLMGKSMIKQVHSVCPDYETSARNLTRYLISLGHQHIGMVFTLMNQPVVDPRIHDTRYSGMRYALHEQGLSFRDEWFVTCDNSLTSACEAAAKLLSTHPQLTAIIGRNDLAAIGTIKAANDLGLAVPNDLSVVGFDNTELGELFHLTTVDGALTEIAERSLDIIIRHEQEGFEKVGCIKQIVDNELIVRGTSAAPPQQRGGKKNLNCKKVSHFVE